MAKVRSLTSLDSYGPRAAAAYEDALNVARKAGPNQSGAKAAVR